MKSSETILDVEHVFIQFHGKLIFIIIIMKKCGAHYVISWNWKFDFLWFKMCWWMFKTLYFFLHLHLFPPLSIPLLHLHDTSQSQIKSRIVHTHIFICSLLCIIFTCWKKKRKKALQILKQCLHEVMLKVFSFSQIRHPRTFHFCQIDLIQLII